MFVKAHLSPQLGQGLALTPQLLQSIRLLQLPAIQLELEVRAALEANPMLELAEDDEAGETERDLHSADSDATCADVAAVDELPEAAHSLIGQSLNNFSGDREDATAFLQAGESTDPRVRILDQLGLSWSATDLRIAAWWLDHVDDRGYLEGSLDMLARAGAAGLQVSKVDMIRVRTRLLHGECPGVTAESLTESLLAQLAAHPASPAREMACRMLEEHADLTAGGNVDALAIVMKTTSEHIHEAYSLLRTLQINPVEDLPVQASDYLVPDAVAWKADGQWHVALNPNAYPAVRINSFAENALSGMGGATQMRDMLDQARWLVRGLIKRNDTLIRTTQMLVQRQSAFLEGGEEELVPLTLADVATELGVHESTVSRIATGKYILTPRGPIEMKQFFASRLEGAQVSGLAVRAMVKRMIDSEKPHAPLADGAIASMLARKGIRVARRTVAKYRDQLSIASARQRGTAVAVNSDH